MWFDFDQIAFNISESNQRSVKEDEDLNIPQAPFWLYMTVYLFHPLSVIMKNLQICKEIFSECCVGFVCFGIIKIPSQRPRLSLLCCSNALQL